MNVRIPTYRLWAALTVSLVAALVVLLSGCGKEAGWELRSRRVTGDTSQAPVFLRPGNLATELERPKLPLFEIDVTRSRRVNWRRFRNLFPNADVYISVHVLEGGACSTSVFHEIIGMGLASDSMKNWIADHWVFKKYKTGRIDFRMRSLQDRVEVVDTSLELLPKYQALNISNGRLYYVSGLSRSRR